jgi:hypothetical protein
MCICRVLYNFSNFSIGLTFALPHFPFHVDFCMPITFYPETTEKLCCTKILHHQENILRANVKAMNYPEEAVCMISEIALFS